LEQSGDGDDGKVGGLGDEESEEVVGSCGAHSCLANFLFTKTCSQFSIIIVLEF
jgi:hypothetical protein